MVCGSLSRFVGAVFESSGGVHLGVCFFYFFFIFLVELDDEGDGKWIASVERWMRNSHDLHWGLGMSGIE